MWCVYVLCLKVVNSNDLPCDNSKDEGTAGCLNYDGGYFVTDPELSVNEYYLRRPSTLAFVNYILFSVSLLSFTLNPHFLQRAFTARQDKQVRFVVIALFFTIFMCQIPGILTGITSISNFGSAPGAFQIILGVFKDIGGFVTFLSYLAMVAAIAGIMSTADSALIGVSNTLSCDVFKNWLTPNLDLDKIVWIGKGISLCTMIIADSIAAYLYEYSIDYGSILTLQSAILWQSFPAYVFGLYTNIHYRSILLGIVLGVKFSINPFSILNTKKKKTWFINCPFMVNS